MSTVVIMPGGFHPFHAGHLALYQSAKRAFPDAEVFVAATNDTSARPFPFAIKEKLAQLAGVDPTHFVQVRSPFRAEEITKQFDPEKDLLIFVRSEKDADKPPQAGGIKKNGEPAYLQPLLGAKRLEPFARHAYMAYLPTVEFGPGMTSATEIRNSWPSLDDQGKLDLVNTLYPQTQGNDRLGQATVKLLDAAILAESVNPVTANTAGTGAGMTSTMSRRYNQPPMEASADYIEEKWSEKYKRSINCSNPRGFSQRAHCAGRKKTSEDATSDLQKDLRKPHSYSAIDHMMTAIAKKHSITPKKLHDIFVKKHGCTPDDWIKKQKRSVTETAPQTALQDKVRAAIARGMQKKTDMAKAEYHSQPTKTTFFDPQGYYSDKMIGIDHIMPDGTVVVNVGDEGKQAGEYVKKIAALGGMPGVKVVQLEPGYQGAQMPSQLGEKCWDTHRQAGMKKKGGRMVPNCVPRESK